MTDISDISEFNRKVIDEFRANNGVMGPPFENMPLLLLGTTGAKSGQPRTNPLAYLEDGDRLIIIASFAGAPKSPPWYHNLKVNPEVTVEVGAEKYQARAEELDDPERSEVYERVAAKMPVFAEYQAKTTRKIPVIALNRI